MSEFSDCYYLLDSDSGSAHQLIRSVGRYSAVFPTESRLTPFLVEEVMGIGSALDFLLPQANAPLLHYAFGSDHGFWLRAFDGEILLFDLVVQKGSNSELAVEDVAEGFLKLGLIAAEQMELVQTTLEKWQTDAPHPEEAREEVERFLEVKFLRWCSCADLSALSTKAFEGAWPAAELVLKSRKGAASDAVQQEPNRWCPVVGLPHFMYIPLPSGDVDSAMLDRHVRHWLETKDWDDDRQAGFWLYSAYKKTLPSRWRFLADRIMNLSLAFPDDYPSALKQTLSAIISILPVDFDWEPYLRRERGEVRL